MLSSEDIARLAGQASASFQGRLDAIRQRASAPSQAKPAPKSASKGASSKKKPVSRNKSAPYKPEVAPYLDSDGLRQLGDRVEAGEIQRSTITNDFANSAAESYRAAQEAGISRVEGTSAAENDAASRGLGRSSIRDANLDKVDAAYGRTVNGLRGSLALKAVQGQGTLRQLGRGDDSAYAALAARAAELASAVPRSAQSPQQAKAQRAAKNIKGAKTQRRG